MLFTSGPRRVGGGRGEPRETGLPILARTISLPRQGQRKGRDLVDDSKGAGDIETMSALVELCRSLDLGRTMKTLDSRRHLQAKGRRSEAHLRRRRSCPSLADGPATLPLPKSGPRVPRLVFPFYFNPPSKEEPARRPAWRSASLDSGRNTPAPNASATPPPPTALPSQEPPAQEPSQIVPAWRRKSRPHPPTPADDTKQAATLPPNGPQKKGRVAKLSSQSLREVDRPKKTLADKRLRRRTLATIGYQKQPDRWILIVSNLMEC